MEEKLRFVFELESGEHTVTELCQQYEIARETGYVWLRRYRQFGVAGLMERSRAAHRRRNQTPEEIERMVLELRQAHMRWGPRKLKRVLERDEPGRVWPATSTIGALLKREGLVVARKKRLRTAPYTEPLAHADGANRVWCADFKGWSFREYGMPEAIRTDNGAPFASPAVAGLSRLAVWWIKLGIVPERIAAGHPEQNGRHERMHRTLKQEVAQPPAANRRKQQRALDGFRQEYNQVRPHEALEMRTPASVYEPSERKYPASVCEPEYPGNMLVRSVRRRGHFRWQKYEVFLSEVLWGERVGLLPEDERWYTMYFAQFPIARFDSQELRVTPLPKTQGWYKGGEAGDMSPASPPARVERDQKVSGMCPV